VIEWLTPRCKYAGGRTGLGGARHGVVGPRQGRLATGRTEISPAGNAAADLISALCTGTNFDIAATDQIRPVATTMAIPIVARICIPSALECGQVMLAYSSPRLCEAVHTVLSLGVTKLATACTGPRPRHSESIAVVCSMSRQ
jgi:hypothetical protein